MEFGSNSRNNIFRRAGSGPECLSLELYRVIDLELGLQSGWLNNGGQDFFELLLGLGIALFAEPRGALKKAHWRAFF